MDEILSDNKINYYSRMNNKDYGQFNASRIIKYRNQQAIIME